MRRKEASRSHLNLGAGWSSSVSLSFIFFSLSFAASFSRLSSFLSYPFSLSRFLAFYFLVLLGLSLFSCTDRLSLSLSLSSGSCSRGVNHPWSGTIYLGDNSLVRVVRLYINPFARGLSRNRLFAHGNNDRSFCGIALRNNCRGIIAVSIYRS